MFTKVLPRLVLFSAFAGASFSAPCAAHAQVRRWVGPEACEDGDALFSRIVAPRLDIEAVVTQVGDRLQLRLTLEKEGERWERVVLGESCEALVEVALVVATMAAELTLPSRVDTRVDARPPCEHDCEGPTAGSTEPAAEPGLPAEPAGELQSPRRSHREDQGAREDYAGDEAREPPDAPSRRFEWPTSWSLSAHVGARFDALSLPSPRAAVDLGIHVRRRWLRLDAGFLATRVASLEQGDASAELGLAAGRVGACGGAARGRFWLGGCAALEFGVVRAVGAGVDLPRAEAAFWAALDLALRAELGVVGRLSFYLEAGAALPLHRPRFLLQGDVVHSTPALSPRAALGLEVRLTR